MAMKKEKRIIEERLYRGELLKTLRKAANLSLDEASRRLFVEIRTLTNYENGSHSAPLEVQRRMIEVYGMDPKKS